MRYRVSSLFVFIPFLLFHSCQTSVDLQSKSTSDPKVIKTINSSEFDVIESLRGRSRNQIQAILRVIERRSDIKHSVSTCKSYGSQRNEIDVLIVRLDSLPKDEYGRLNELVNKERYLYSPTYANDVWDEDEYIATPLPIR